jgi:hypothetical protein
MDSSRPLDNFPLIRTHDIEELRAALAQIYVKRRWLFRHRLSAGIGINVSLKPTFHIK